MGRSRRSGSIRFNYNNGNDDHLGPVGPGSADADLREEDVIWSTVEDGTSRSDQSTTEYVDRSIRSRRWLNGEDRGHVGGLSLAFKDGGGGGNQSAMIIQQCHHDDEVETPRGRHVAASAPVNVPDNWPMMSRAESNGSSHGWTEEDQDEEDTNELVPPHVYLAREYARRHKAAATSVLEGVGRTLKGRDMSRVRDAVWSQTGFDG
ncbi:hypothetical protein Syun_026975 [Stephania yunnanensis]|uniref:Senescence regulator S40 n=1 Tax=Stephania yunnanensis TaxID=152371 RepID=A0AAP0ENI9_9MAGN